MVALTRSSMLAPAKVARGGTSGRFGVTAEYLAHAEELEIKIAQGSKPEKVASFPATK